MALVHIHHSLPQQLEPEVELAAGAEQAVGQLKLVVVAHAVEAKPVVLLPISRLLKSLTSLPLNFTIL